MLSYFNREYPYKNNEVIVRAQFLKLVPTDVAIGVTNLVIEGGNHTNCIYPVGTIINGGLHCLKDYCKHIHPEWTELPDEKDFAIEGELPNKCRHVTEVIELDNKVIGYVREDIVIKRGF